MNGAHSIVFYDGECALCHGFVKFVLKYDKKKAFYFSPLQGETIAKLVPLAEREILPDSIVVRAFAGDLYLRSNGIIYVLKRLGVIAKILAGIISIFPRPLRDLGYRIIAALRKKTFSKPKSFCPLIPPEVRERFLP